MAEFRGKIEDGKLKLRDMEEYHRVVSDLEGEEIYLKIKEWKNRRSDRQNRYYYGVVIRILSEDLGYSKDLIHALMSKKFLEEKVVLGEMVLPSTRNLKTDEFEEYLRNIRMWAARDMDIYIPTPNEAPWGFAYEE